MENQHRQITGYRELTAGEIALMNRIKALGAELEQVGADVKVHLDRQARDALNATCALAPDAAEAGHAEQARIARAKPGRWAAIADTHFQQGLMALTRAVAQPTTY